MAELKTKKNKKSVSVFLKSIADDRKRKDAETIMKMIRRITKETPTMWGDSNRGVRQLSLRV